MQVEAWKRDQRNLITFVLVNAAYTEVTGLAGTFTLQLSKGTGAFAASTGTKGEIGNGWYYYLATTAEADTIGPVSVRITGAGIIQQNLEYVVKQRNFAGISYTYTVTDADSGVALPDVWVWVSTDLAGANKIWVGVTDEDGVARDLEGDLPHLDAATYYFWKHRAGMIDDDNPDTEVVS